MKTTKLPWGATPDILSVNGVTYLAYSTDNGLIVYRFPDNLPENRQIVYTDPYTVGLGCPRFLFHDGSVYLAYRKEYQGSNESFVIGFGPQDIEYFPGLVLSVWSGLNTVCWDFVSGKLWVQHNPDKNTDPELVELWLGDFQLEKTEFVGTKYTNALGLAWAWTGLNQPPALVNDVDNLFPNSTRPAQNQDKFYTAQNVSGGVNVFTETQKIGTLNSGQVTHDPRGALQQNGRMAIAYWNPKEFGTSLTLVTDISNEDIAEKPIPTPGAPVSTRKRFSSMFFNRSIRYGNNTEWIGNVTTITDEVYPLGTLSPAEPFIVNTKVGKDQIVMYQDKIMAYFAGGGDINGVIKEYHTFDDCPEKPIIAYIDGRTWPENFPPELPRQKTWTAVQAYRGQGETINDFKKAIEVLLKRFTSWGTPIFLISLFSDRLGTVTERELAEVQYLYNEWVDAYQIIGEIAFADRRPSGLISHPSLRPYLDSRFNVSIRPTRYQYWTSSDDWRRRLLTDLQTHDTLIKLGSQEDLYLISLIRNNLGV